jgi:Uma2 family endonuclease
MTLEEFDALPEDGFKHELNRGELVTMTLPMPRHNLAIMRITLLLARYLEEHPVGRLFPSNTPFILSAPGEPVTLRGPDLAFLSNERFAAIDLDKKIQRAAELTIEVVSPSDTERELVEKVAQYLGAGGQGVWVVYPEEREVRIFDASRPVRVLGAQDRIDAPELLPGFSAPVAAFFE